MSDEKTRIRIVGDREYEFACKDCSSCLGVAENADGTKSIASTSGHIIPSASDEEIREFIKLYESNYGKG